MGKDPLHPAKKIPKRKSNLPESGDSSLTNADPLTFLEKSPAGSIPAGHKKFSNYKIGVLALQGAFEKHCKMVAQLGAAAILIKRPQDLKQIDALIIPGGESTTILHQIEFIGLFPALHDFAKQKPIFGTCAGLILMSRKVISSEAMPLLNILDIAVERNAFGRQIESFKADLEVTFPTSTAIVCPAVFIRAPRIKEVGPEVSILAAFEGEPVLVKQGIHLGSSFHPELTEDIRIHHYFLSQIEKTKS